MSVLQRVTAVRARDTAVLLLVLFAAALLRFAEPGVVEFFHDEAMVADLAQQMVSGERWPLTGIISSVGIPNPPWTIYALALPFAVSSDPLIATLFIMAWNTFGVGVVWWIGHRYLGRLSGVIAAMTYALNPWAILYSRKIWAQEYHTAFLLIALALCLYGIWEISHRPSWRERRFWAQVATPPLMLIGMQIHFAAWFLMPAFVYLYWRGRRSLSLLAALIAVALAIATLSPFLIGLAQTLHEDPNRISSALERSSGSGLSLTAQPVDYLASFATGLRVETWVAPEQQADMLAAVPSLPLWWLIGLSTVLGAFVGLLQWSPSRSLGALLICWAIIPFLFFLVEWTRAYPHYFIASIPGLAILAALGMRWLYRTLNQWHMNIVLLAVYAFILITQGLWWRGALRYLDQMEIQYPGFTTPLHYLQTIRDTVTGSDDVIILSYGMSWSLHHESVVWPVLLRDSARCVRTLVGEGYLVYPAQPFTVLVAPDAPRGSTSYQLYTSNETQTFATRTGGVPYAVHRWDAAPRWDAAQSLNPGNAKFSNGVQMTGYLWQDERIIVEWRLPQGDRVSPNWQYSIQIHDSTGERIAQADRPFWHTRHWCTNDQLITWVNGISTASGAAEMRVSLYRLLPDGRIENSNILDSNGQSIGQQAIIPLN